MTSHTSPVDVSNPLPRVLVVEDDYPTCQLYSHLLALEGFQAEVASDGEEALSSFAHYDPHIVILDLAMPRLSGVEVIRSIRASGSRVPILVLTGSGQDLIAPAIRAGANEVLVKPVEIDGMLSALHRYL